MVEPENNTLRKLQDELQRLRHNELELRRALAGANMGMWDWDMITNHITWSERTEALFGIEPGTFDGSFEMFVGPIPVEDRPLLDQAIQRAIADDTPLVVEHRVVWRDGTVRWVRGQGSAIRNAAGQPIRMTGICQDVTERIEEKAVLRRALEQAQEASRLKNAILANMSHEIRTPMTAILGYADILSERLGGQPEQRYADIVRDGGRRLLHLLDNIVDLARIEADRLSLAPEPHRLADTVAKAIEILQLLAERKGLNLVVNADPTVWVYSDPRREEQVLTNVISNAIRFTDAGSVVVEARWAGRDDGTRQAELRVIDTGVGIDPAFLPHIFEEFRQESEGFSRRHEGSGLGLSIAKKLIEKMQGTITIESEKGRGTTVSIRLPQAAAAGLSAGPRPAVVHEERRGRLLVIEDERAIGQLICDLLPRHDVVWKDTAEEALSLIAAGQAFDLVLLDIHLKPGRLDGLTAMRRLRESGACLTVPVVALTAYAMKGDRERFLNEGFADYLAKPFTREDLERIVSLRLATA